MIAIAWGTVASAVIIALPLMESWETIESVLLGMFTNDRVMEKMEEMDSKLQTIISSISETERARLLEENKDGKKQTSEIEVQVLPG